MIVEIKHTGTISERLAEIRKHLALSQEGMAKLMGSSQSYYSRMESNADDMRVKHILALSMQGFSIDWLIAGMGSMKHIPAGIEVSRIKAIEVRLIMQE